MTRSATALLTLLALLALHGPHVWNFAEIYAALDAARGAAEVADPDALTDWVDRLLRNAALRKTSQDAATKTVARLGGALNRTMASLEPYLLQLRLERQLTDA